MAQNGDQVVIGREKTANTLPVAESAAQPKDGHEPIEKKNELFEKFYRAQKLVPDEQWDVFMAALRRDLPHTIRLVGCEKTAAELLHILKNDYFPSLLDVCVDEENVQLPSELPWYPNGFGLKMNLSRQVIRKHDGLKRLHRFLVAETELGNISRQEEVSMIPPLLLDVASDSKVLDMCAAPGSKTGQLIEMIHANCGSDLPKGFVLANDVDNRRCYLLVHQSLKRLNSPCCIVTNSDSAVLPNLVTENEIGELVPLRFDRVLCDVPCSGDGTVRKNINIWRDWHLYQTYGTHKLQIRIARRGLQLLEVGGRLVYSTCSLNPAENEAVIARLLDEFRGAVELLDVSDRLPGLIRSPGLTQWKIMDQQGNFVDSFADVRPQLRNKIPATLFPPSPEEAAQLHLDRCLRILPHYQDSGGFFVAVLTKTADVTHHHHHAKTDQSITSGACDQATQPSGEPVRKKPRVRGYNEDPFIFDGLTEICDRIRDHFGIDESFPFENVLTRSGPGTKKRNLYLVNDAVKKIITCNNAYIKIINSGLRIFGRTGEKTEHCTYRLTQDGLDYVLPFVHKRKIDVDVEDLASILVKGSKCFFHDLTEAARKAVEALCEGNLVVCSHLEGRSFAITAWRGKATVSPYLDKVIRAHILRALGRDPTMMEVTLLSKDRTYPVPDKSSSDSNSKQALLAVTV